MKILVADDSPTMRRIVVGQLKQTGYSDIVEAEDGAQALRKLEDEKFDFLLTDWNMPYMNGLELIREVRRRDALKGLPIVVVTTRKTKGDILAAMKEGANNYVVKPFGPKVLAEKINNVLKALSN